MTANTISEAEFLLTELRYTLGQLHVQVLDLDAETRKSALCGDRSIEQILQDLVQQEETFQGRYADLMRTSAPEGSGTDQPVPLPTSQAEETSGTESTFEHLRAQTIAMLEGTGGTWPPALLEAVKDQVAADRKATTEIAECRKQYFEQPQRPDLTEPLTAENG